MYDPAMPSNAPQSFQNHARRDVVFLTVGVIFLINAIAQIVRTVQINLHHFNFYSILRLAVSIALVLLALTVRRYATHNQDRLIRLEERLRFAAILPPTLLTQSAALTEKQYVALRFASDAEIPTLIQRTLTENLAPKQIKEAITTWRTDDFRV
jgi:hypothetical protein